MFEWLCENFGQMHGTGVVILRDLFATAEAVANDDGLICRIADSGEKNTFGKLLGQIELVFFKTEGAGHAAAA